jgi:2-polyprenyl-3-methyl-5-hydroxy-6-metoxy-1,4-benzoquinol methylase
VDPDYGIAYEDLYRRHWWWRARERLIALVLERFAPDSGWEGILDIGCGNGLTFDCLEQFGTCVHGIEADRRLVSEDGPHRHQIHVGPFDATYEPPVVFSLVTMFDVLEHIEDPLSALERVRSLASPNANLFVTVPAFSSLWTSHDDLNHHHVRYTRGTLKKLMHAAAVKVLHMEYFFHWVAPAKLVVRLKERVAGVSSASVPTVPPMMINRLLYGLSRSEQMLPSSMKPPFGSSLLLMGQFGTTDG